MHVNRHILQEGDLANNFMSGKIAIGLGPRQQGWCVFRGAWWMSRVCFDTKSHAWMALIHDFHTSHILFTFVQNHLANVGAAWHSSQCKAWSASIDAKNI